MESPDTYEWTSLADVSVTQNLLVSDSPVTARCTFMCRLGTLGTFEISVQGLWEDHDDDVASVSFDSFSAQPLELFGRKLDGVPQV